MFRALLERMNVIVPITATAVVCILFPSAASAQVGGLPALPPANMWPAALRESRNLLEIFERTGDRNAAKAALAGFVSNLKQDSTYQAHYGAARTLYTAPFLVPPTELVIPSSQLAALRLMTESDGRIRSADAAWITGLLALEADRESGVHTVLRAFLDSEWSVSDTGFVGVIDDLAARIADPQLLADVGEKLAAATGDRGFSFRGILWRSAIDGDRARIKEMYDSAITHAGPLSLHALRRDGYFILDAEPLALTAQALTRMWTRIAAVSGLSAGDRIAEHYIRVAVARRKYRAPPRTASGAPSEGALGRIYGPFDHRGEIYIRHGAPDQVIVSPGMHLRPTETWIYDVPRGGASYFTFALFPGSSGFVLMDNYLEAVAWEGTGERVQSGNEVVNLGNAKIAALARLGVFDELGSWFSMRDQSDPRFALVGAAYSRISALVRLGNFSAIRDILVDNHMDNLRLMAAHTLQLREAIASQSVVPKFSLDIPFAADLYQFRESEGSVLYAALATQLQHVQPPTGRREIAARVQLIIDTNIIAVDTVIRFNVPAGAPRTSAIGFIVPLHLAPFNADGNLLITLRSGDAGRQVQAKHRLRELRGLAVSEVVVAEDRETGTFERGNVRLTANPHGQLPLGAAAVLYYEVYGLADGEAYETEWQFERVNEPGLSVDDLKMLIGRAQTSLRLQFSGQADNASEVNGIQERREITTELAPGLYEVTVRVTQSATGRIAESTRNIRIVPRRN